MYVFADYYIVFVTGGTNITVITFCRNGTPEARVVF